ncbi:MAG: ABC transporter ATP-binding protein [Verrucomicrobia bacterium]|nr:ABC transporter ATP-binding protein [Verrucomicrobiota bacterium]
MSDGRTLLKLTNVNKAYASVEGGEVVSVLRDISFEVHAGESLAIIGPSGSGKSTLLNIIGTLDQASSGQVSLDGEELSGLNEEQTATVRNRKIGFIFQSHHLLPQCTVLENVLVPTMPDKSLREGAEARARKLLDRVGLGQRLSHRPGQLSGGERQRVAVVRALINQPKLLLADEPTGALDRHSAESLADLLVELNREQQVTLIVVTHALNLAQRMQRQFALE